MSTALGLGILAALLQMSDAPTVPTNIVPAAVASSLLPYMPDSIYAGATSTGEALTYVGGVDWQTGKRWGVGAEYRQWRDSVSLLVQSHDIITHIAGPYIYRELPPFGRLTLRTEAGAGILWVESATLSASSTWAASVRASARIELSSKFDLILWFGGVRIAGAAINTDRYRARTKTTDHPETGIALRLRF